MTSNPITVEEDTPISEAQQIMRENKIRRLPVLRKQTLVGIVTQTDLREYSPSKATTLNIWELHYLLSKVTVKEAMQSKPVTIGPDESISQAALLMEGNRIGALPVVENGQVIGIVTESDVFRALIKLTGIKLGGIEVGIELEDKPGSLKDAADMIREKGLKIHSILCSHEGAPEGFRRVWFRIAGEGLVKEDLSGLFREQFKVLDISSG
jgi:acetoin utilization protein AcuB